MCMLGNSRGRVSTGGKISRDAGPVKGGKTVIAFVEDPTGYKWELITREEPIKEPIAQVLPLQASTSALCHACTDLPMSLRAAERLQMSKPQGSCWSDLMHD